MEKRGLDKNYNTNHQMGLIKVVAAFTQITVNTMLVVLNSVRPGCTCINYMTTHDELTVYLQTQAMSSCDIVTCDIKLPEI